MTLTRQVGLLGATGIGVGAMLGAGVFSGMWADVLAAGRWYLAAVALAGAVALANALSTAQLAARYPVAGGAYAYGRAELGTLPGHIAGAAFVVGKTVSVAVGALVLGAYVLPGHPQGVASAAIVLCWALNARGITKTATGATVIAVVVSLALAALVAMAVFTEYTFGWFVGVDSAVVAADAPGPVVAVLTGAAAAFFAFAGYARIATLGEEVRDPARIIPRAIIIALGCVLALYLAIAFALNRVVSPLGAEDSAPVMVLSEAPLESLAELVGFPVWVVSAAAVLAVAGAMLAVMAGAGRTAMAMAREGDLPRALARQGSAGAPWAAEAVVAALAIALVWTHGANLILVSAASILIYYSVANIAAICQRRAGRTVSLRVPVAVSIGGLAGCTVLASVALAGSSQALAPAIIVVALVIGWPVTACALRVRHPR